MKRKNVAAILVAAALIGGGGGAYAALVRDPEFRTATPSGSGSTARSGTPSASAPGPAPSGGGPADGLFYLVGATIHDGDRTAPFKGRGGDWWVASLERAGENWLIVEGRSDGGEHVEYEGTVVHPDGGQLQIGALGEGWDVDSDGRILTAPEHGAWVAIDSTTGESTQLPIVDGPGEELPSMTENKPRQWIQAVGQDVLTWWTGPSGAYLVRTELDGYTHTEVGPAGVHFPAVPPTGEFAVSLDADPDNSDTDSFCTSGGTLSTSQWWRTCDWRTLDRLSPFSPDGTRLLAVDIRSDGFGPGGFMILAAATGDEEYELETPEWTSDAAWIDNSTILVEVNADGDPSGPSTLYRIDVESGEQQQLKRLKRNATLGDP
jgi:hypothetical protein